MKYVGEGDFMKKLFLQDQFEARITLLKRRYASGCVHKNVDGTPLSKGNATAIRTLTKRDLNTCILFKELLAMVGDDVLDLSDEAMNGLERLVMPVERHKREPVIELGKVKRRRTNV